MSSPPETRYTRSGGVNIAYQVVGDGGLDLVYIPGWVSHVERCWEEPSAAKFLGRLAGFSRLILFDKRGTGLSDRVPLGRLPTLEERVDDLRAVMEAAGSERAALFGWSEGANLSMMFAATQPARTMALAVFGAFATRVRTEDYPWAPTPEQRGEFFRMIEQSWGGTVDLETIAPSAVGDERFERWWAAYLRSGASPGAALALAQMNTEIDVRRVLPTVHVPTLVLHRTEDADAHVEEGRYIAARIPGARFVELPGRDHVPFVGDGDRVVDELELFFTGVHPAPPPQRMLATVLFTDIAGSTDRAVALGDSRWRDLLETHNALVRKSLVQFEGSEIDTAGDGFFAVFEGPARAIRCAQAIQADLEAIGVPVRAGIHIGECEIADGKVAGIAVNIGARIAGLAGPGEVLVSRTVKDLVAGSGISFSDHGMHDLKGIPEQWQLYAVDGSR